MLLLSLHPPNPTGDGWKRLRRAAASQPVPRHGLRLTGAGECPGGSAHAQEEQLQPPPTPEPQQAEGSPQTRHPEPGAEGPEPRAEERDAARAPRREEERQPRSRPEPSNCAPNQPAADLGATTVLPEQGALAVPSFPSGKK